MTAEMTRLDAQNKTDSAAPDADKSAAAPRQTAPLRLYLVRHGETAWSLTGQHTGLADIPLTAKGENEARALAGLLRDIPFTHTLVSPRQRAWRTQELALPDAAAAVEPGLAEWDYGDYEGLRTAEILRQQPDWNLFRDGCPRGESPAQVANRADRLIARLRVLSGNVALFSHGHFGGVLAARWIGLPLSAAEHLPLGTASLSILGYALRHADISVISLWNAAPRDLSGAPNEPQKPADAADEQ